MPPGTIQRTLLQAVDDGRVAEVLVWLGVAMGLLILGLALAARLKRKAKQEDEATPAMGFTLSDLRQMHRAGQLDDAEFAKAKAKIVDAAQREPERAAAAAQPALAADPKAFGDRHSAEAIRARRRAREDPRRGFDVLPPSPDPDDPAGESPK